MQGEKKTLITHKPWAILHEGFQFYGLKQNLTSTHGTWVAWYPKSHSSKWASQKGALGIVLPT